ncbi:hypothetical protein [Rothia endophytica]
MPKATAIFICDVRVRPEKIHKSSAWSQGTWAVPSGTRRDGSQLYSDGGWRAQYFPSTMSPFLYGDMGGSKSLTMIPVRYHHECDINVMPYIKGKERRTSDGSNMLRFPEVTHFTIRRLELLIADRVIDGVALAQLAIVSEVEANTEEQVKNVIRSFASAFGGGDYRGVRGRDLHEVVEKECVNSHIDFPTAKSLKYDTEANTYTAIFLQKSPQEVEEIKNGLPAGFEDYEPFLPLLVEYTTNLTPQRAVEDKERFDQEQETRFLTFNRVGYGYFARYYAAFIAVEDNGGWRSQKFAASFEAEYLDALLLGRLQDQMLRQSELRLVQAMAGAAHSNNLGKTSDQVMALYREIEVDSVRYWMDDASANTGKTMEVLREFKKAIEFYKRYGAMKQHAETIMNIATRDQQEAALESQDRIALVLAIVGALVIPLPLLNDSFDFMDRVAQQEIFVSWQSFVFWFLLSGLTLGLIVGLVNWLLSLRRGRLRGVFSVLRPRNKHR